MLCIRCGNHSEYQCSKCHIANYCNKECQRKDWISMHKSHCRNFTKLHLQSFHLEKRHQFDVPICYYSPENKNLSFGRMGAFVTSSYWNTVMNQRGLQYVVDENKVKYIGFTSSQIFNHSLFSNVPRSESSIIGSNVISFTWLNLENTKDSMDIEDEKLGSVIHLNQFIGTVLCVFNNVAYISVVIDIPFDKIEGHIKRKSSMMSIFSIISDGKHMFIENGHERMIKQLIS
jgi:hypothetical protein